jgi:tyrosyl-tRNA synthetase
VHFAQEIVERFHSRAAAEQALVDFELRSKGGIPDDVPEVTVTLAHDSIPVAQLLKQANLVASTSEALRMIDQGGVKLDGEKVNDKAITLARGVTVTAQVGKRKFAKIKII